MNLHVVKDKKNVIPISKGKKVNIPLLEYGYNYGNITEIKDASK